LFEKEQETPAFRAYTS